MAFEAEEMTKAGQRIRCCSVCGKLFDPERDQDAGYGYSRDPFYGDSDTYDAADGYCIACWFGVGDDIAAMERHDRIVRERAGLLRVFGPAAQEVVSLRKAAFEAVLAGDTPRFDKLAAGCRELFAEWRRATRDLSEQGGMGIRLLAEEASTAVTDRNESRLTEIAELLKEHAASNRVVQGGAEN